MGLVLPCNQYQRSDLYVPHVVGLTPSRGAALEVSAYIPHVMGLALRTWSLLGLTFNIPHVVGLVLALTLDMTS